MKSVIENNPNFGAKGNPAGRLYFLDNLKTFIILLVVFFHSAYAYAVYWSQNWYVVDSQKNLFFDLFITGAFAFMMPVMFFVAGYFGIRSLARKGQLSFWRDKLNRIIIPWALGVIILAPAIGYMHSVSRNLYPSYLNYWAHYFFGMEYQSHGQVHFYFLGMLTLYYLVLAAVYRIYPRLGEVSEKPERRSRWFFILFGLVTGLLFFGGNLIIDEGIWVKFGIFDLPATRLIPYLCYFFLGVLAFKRKWFTPSGYNPKLKIWVPLCVLSFVLLTFFLGKKVLVAYALSYFFFCIAAVFTLLALFQKRLDFTSGILSRFSANSYAIYFLHYFVILWIILALREFQWNVFAKWLSVGIVSWVICYSAARYALAKTPLFSTKMRPLK